MAADGAGRGAAASRVAVWDPWIRLVHWAIVLLLPTLYFTAKADRFDLHYIAGYAMLALLVFRIAWGLVGSDTARFAGFLKNPLEGLRHLAHFRRRDEAVEIGHNAAGGWMVLVLLGLLAAQATTGLFAAHDPGMTYSQHGPLAMRVSEETSDLATRIHLRVFWVIVGAAVLHILAVIAYRVVRRQNLVKPMLTGTLEVPPGYAGPRPRMGNPMLAAALLAAAAGFAWWISSLRPVSFF
jgi:cytochrome b